MARNMKKREASKAIIKKARAILKRYYDGGNTDILRECVTDLEALLANPAFVEIDLDFRLQALLAAGELHRSMYEALLCEGIHDMVALERAIVLLHQGLLLCPKNSLYRSSFCLSLGLSLRHRFLRAQNKRDLNNAIRLTNEAGKGPQTDPDRRAIVLNNLGLMLRDRYESSCNEKDLTQAIEVFRSATNLMPAESLVAAECWNGLGSALFTQYKIKRQPGILEEAIGACERAVYIAKRRVGYKLDYLSNLALLLIELWNLRRDLAVLDRVIKLSRKAVAETPDWSRDHTRFLMILKVLVEGSAYDHRLTDLQELVKKLEEAVKRSPCDSPMWVSLQDVLASALRRLFEVQNDAASLDKAINVLREAAEHSASDLRGSFLAPLAELLYTRYGRAGDPSDIAAAIKAAEGGLSLSPSNPWLLRILGVCLGARYKLSGKERDLTCAVSRLEDAVRQAPLDPLLSADIKRSIGSLLRDRYLRTGCLDDITRAIDEMQGAVDLMPSDSCDRALFLADLGLAYFYRAEIENTSEDVDKALVALEEAVSLSPSAPALRSFVLGCLGIVLQTLSEDATYADRAITALEEAVRLDPTSPNCLVYRMNLAVGLMVQYGRTQHENDLQRAIAINCEIIQDAALDVPMRPTAHANLSYLLRYQYELSGKDVDLQEALKHFKLMVRLGLDYNVSVVLYCARNWGDWAYQSKNWAVADYAYRHCVDALERLFHAQLLRSDKEIWLRQVQGLAEAWAYVLVQTGHADDAVVAVERGRALLLGEVLQGERANLEQLKKMGRDDLYERYFAAVRQWQELISEADTQHRRLFPLDPLLVRLTERWSGQGLGNIVTAGASPGKVGEAMLLMRAELDRIVEEIRSLPGYQRFLASPNLDEIVEAAADMPLVYLVTAPDGGFALVVEPEGIGIKTVWLPDLEAVRVRVLMVGLFANYTAWRTAPNNEEATLSWRQALDNIAMWLGAVLEPLMHCLGRGSRAVIVRTGLLSMIPLQIGWTEEPHTPTGRRYILDDIMLCYAPSARAFTAARRIARSTPPNSLLAVDQPRPVSASDLPGSEQEVAAARAGFDEGKLLRHKKATRKAVLEAIPHYQVLHFSCHGNADVADPLASGLLLARDKPLTLKDLLGLHLAGVHLAVLSACETAVSGLGLPDEVVSLPSGLLQAGVGGVIATQWSVDSLGTMMMLYRFYDLWRGKDSRGRQAPAEALRYAQIWLRDTTDEQKIKYFQSSLPEFSGQGLAPSAARWAYYQLIAKPPGEDTFSQLCCWGAFTYTGASVLADDIGL